MSERKYGQRGYMDDDRDRPRGRSQSGPPPRREGPRGRGLGKPTASVCRCAVCGESQTVSELTADSTCGKCGTDLYTCTHCAHFDTSASGECRRGAPYVAAKAKRNRCELFEPKMAQEFASDSGTPKDAKAAFDALFKL